MKEPVITRKQESEKLQRCLSSNRSELVIVYGRRRVGKTFLVESFFKNTYDFKFVGARNLSTRIQLGNFAKELSKRQGGAPQSFKNWFDAFFALEQYLEALPNDKKKVLFFDEMPWIDSLRSDFVSAFEYFWNSWAVSQRNIMLVATGSATSWMVDKLVENKGGLHGRITSHIHVSPFTLHEVEEYLQGIGADWDRYQTLQSYMLLGGVPFYYSMIDPQESLAQNVDRLFFREDGALRLEFDELYHALFSNADLYINIVKLLCSHKSGLTHKEISKSLNLEGGKLTRVLNNLEKCDFIEKWTQYGNKKREAQYRIIDFYTIFYYKFVAPNNYKDDHWWSDNINSRSVTSWMGNAFELVCMRHHKQVKYKLHIDSIATSIYTWHKEADEELPGAQIDMIIERADRIIHLCEIKFSEDKYTIDKDYEMKLRERAGIFRAATKNKKAIVHTFITTYGVVDGKHKSIVHSEVTMDDLFEEIGH